MNDIPKNLPQSINLSRAIRTKYKYKRHRNMIHNISKSTIEKKQILINDVRNQISEGIICYENSCCIDAESANNEIKNIQIPTSTSTPISNDKYLELLLKEYEIVEYPAQMTN
jgi:hypothetical protein